MNIGDQVRLRLELASTSLQSRRKTAKVVRIIRPSYFDEQLRLAHGLSPLPAKAVLDRELGRRIYRPVTQLERV